MRDVYGGCSANLIYLGESDEYTESALSSIRAIVREAEASTHGLRDMGTILYNDDNRKKYSKIGLKASIDIKGLASFFSLPWFRCVRLLTVGCACLISKYPAASGSFKKRCFRPEALASVGITKYH